MEGMTTRQPIHVVYGGAHLFKPDTASRLGRIALAAAEEYGPLPEALGVSQAVAGRVLDKLRTEPVEDYRIDFEDGYGYRSDSDEDGHAVAAARAVREGLSAGSLPPNIGFRVKSLAGEARRRALRTLELFLKELGSPRPANFVVTLPKVTAAEQVAALAARYDGAIEIMVETPQCFECGNLVRFVEAGAGRVRGAHFGPFDYTSSIGITSKGQDLRHPACDMARHWMQVALVPAGVWLSDGPTNVMPVARDRGAEGVREAWRTHFANVRHALHMGFYQGWDLHPAQLVSRYAAVYSFFEESAGEAAQRLRNFVEKQAQATMVGQTFDDAASVLGLANFFLRAAGCGAMDEAGVQQLTGLTLAQLERCHLPA